MAVVSKSSFCTYNIRGYGPVVVETIKSIMPNCSFLLLQETWEYEQAFIKRFEEDFKDYPYECISANKNDLREIKDGQIRGGTSICYNTNTNCVIETIPTKTKCFCVQKIKIGHISLLENKRHLYGPFSLIW